MWGCADRACAGEARLPLSVGNQPPLQGRSERDPGTGPLLAIGVVLRRVAAVWRAVGRALTLACV
jgi:hypothetical protein